MIKLLWRFFLLVLLASAFTWLANRPGSITLTWLGYEVHISLLVVVLLALLAVLLLWLVWSVVYRLWQGPKNFSTYLKSRKNRKAYEALSNGLIAASAGDGWGAEKQALIARNGLADEPLLRVLEAQSAQLRGDSLQLRQSFEEMLASPKTEVLGLRGLFSEARQKGDVTAAMNYAERALKLNPRLAWASTAVLQLQTMSGNWSAAAQTLVQQARAGITPPAQARWQEAAMLTAEALRQESKDQHQALTLALKAHRLNPALVPAALVAARIYASQGSVRKASKIIRRTWQQMNHPDLALLASRLNPKDKREQRYERVRDLVSSTSQSEEGAYALARAALEDERYEAARKILTPYLDQPQSRFCLLMQQIESASGNHAAAQNWLSRAIYAPRDPMWVSDGVASPHWVAISPVTGDIVPCHWKPPFELAPAAEAPSLTSLTSLTSAPQTPELPSPTVEVAKIEIIQNQRPPDDPGLEMEEKDRTNSKPLPPDL